MFTKRVFDIVCVVFGILILLPFLIFISVWIKLDSEGPVFYKQERIGLNGKPFRIFKFRTMVTDADKKGLPLTVGVDSRITRSGHFLRKYKLDEFPQLFNVLIGNMSLVGPRPEVAKYVAYYPEEIKKLVLSVPPGITDNASIIYKQESDLLGNTDNPEKLYIEEILPKKMEFYIDYINKRSLLLDLKLIFKTLLEIVYK